MAPAPAATQAAASRASASALSGTAGWSARIRSPLSAAWRSTRRRLRAPRTGQRALDERSLGVGVGVGRRPRPSGELALEGLVVSAQARGSAQPFAEEQLAALGLAARAPDVQVDRVVGRPEHPVAG